MNLDEVWNPAANGVGALLMTDPSLPRDPYGHPYQALYWFDEANTPLGLVIDSDGHVLVYENNPEGHPLASDPPGCERAPEAVERAAKQWWSEQE